MKENERINIPESEPDPYAENAPIKAAIAEFYRTGNKNAILALLSILLRRMAEDGEAPAPMVDADHVMDAIDPETITVGEDITLERDLRLTMDTMMDGEGNQWIPLFTDTEELERGTSANIRINAPIRYVLESGLYSERAQGVVINPFGTPLELPKEILRLVLERMEKPAD